MSLYLYTIHSKFEICKRSCGNKFIICLVIELFLVIKTTETKFCHFHNSRSVRVLKKLFETKKKYLLPILLLLLLTPKFLYDKAYRD